VFVIPLALVPAVPLRRNTRGVAFFRALSMLPIIKASGAVEYVWTGRYDRLGSLNHFLKSIGPAQMDNPTRTGTLRRFSAGMCTSPIGTRSAAGLCNT
jgi:ABC-type sugar transport system permease subunit